MLLLDPFQRRAAAAIDRGESVLVAAPTGAGKTLVADHAIDRALARGGKAFYTTPLKALSNQKFRDLSARLGTDAVGLLTGDRAVRPDAPVVVMTTEVLRALLYDTRRRSWTGSRRSSSTSSTTSRIRTGARSGRRSSSTRPATSPSSGCRRPCPTSRSSMSGSVDPRTRPPWSSRSSARSRCSSSTPWGTCRGRCRWCSRCSWRTASTRWPSCRTAPARSSGARASGCATGAAR